MKALLIDAEQQTIEETEVQGREDIARLVGYDTLESDAIGPDGDRLYFDEECFLRGTGGRFQIDSVIPVSGKGVVVGANADGSELKDVTSTPETLRERLKYLS